MAAASLMGFAEVMIDGKFIRFVDGVRYTYTPKLCDSCEKLQAPDLGMPIIENGIEILWVCEWCRP